MPDSSSSVRLRTESQSMNESTATRRMQCTETDFLGKGSGKGQRLAGSSDKFGNYPAQASPDVFCY